MTGEEDDGGDMERSSAAEYCSLSECIVMPDSARGCVASWDIVAVGAEGSGQRAAGRGQRG